MSEESQGDQTALLLRKMDKCEPLSDADLEALTAVFKAADRQLAQVDLAFPFTRLARVSVLSTLERLENMREYRKHG